MDGTLIACGPRSPAINSSGVRRRSGVKRSSHADTLNDTHPGQRPGRRALTSSMLGNSIEFYEFAVYGLAAALVFKDIFFPSFSGTAGTPAVYGDLCDRVRGTATGATATALPAADQQKE